LAPLRRYVGRLIGDADAQDIVQAAHAKVYAVMQHQNVQHPRALLYTTARNLALDEIKHRGRSPFEDVPHAADVIGGNNVADAVTREEQHRLLRANIANLPEPCREVLLLRMVEQLSHESISQRLGVPRKTVEKRLYRAMRLLHDALRPAAEEGTVIALNPRTGSHPRP
jgi:RNA polymerase sigma factor (sigma-70 family)